jgi:hypothetical protein
MKKLIIAALAIACAAPAFAGSVSGYYKKNGTYVQRYNRSSADSTQRNNYSFKGNVNPYTGRVGTKNCNYSTSC